MFNFSHEVSDIEVSCWNASSFLVEYFGKQDLREVLFKIFLLSAYCRQGTDLGTGDATGKKCKHLLRAFTYGLDDCCVIQEASTHKIHLSRPRIPSLRNKSDYLENIQIDFSLS